MDLNPLIVEVRNNQQPKIQLHLVSSQSFNQLQAKPLYIDQLRL